LPTLDKLNIKILEILQRDCRLPVADVAAAVGLSPSACHRRIKMLEESGFIERYAAQLNRRKLGFTLEFFVEVTLVSQREDALAAFEAAVRNTKEILECHLMAGGTDYLLRVVAADVADYERIYREHIAKLPGVGRVTSHLAFRTVRGWSGYPVAAHRGSER
jgi:Lrp/AsnC family leucine-responsive transcriptional regulator